jgi:hypothetical protein
MDKKTGDPIIAATLTGKGSPGTITDSLGRFELVVEKLPSVLMVSHVAYGMQIITLSKRTAEVVIRLEPRENRIPEVRVTASGQKSQVRILNKKTRYTITDYQFDGPYMWFIGCRDNSPRGTRLYLGNPYGDTVCSVPIPPNVRLYRDVLGKIHLVRPDTVYQLHAGGDSIRLLYPECTEKFMGLMNAYEVAFAGGLARLDYDSEDDELYLVYKDSTLDRPKRIFLFSRQKGYLERRYAWIGRYFGSRTLRLMIHQQKENYFLKMRSSLFTFRDTLYVVNLSDNQLHLLDRELNEIRLVPITFFFKETDDITDAYIPFRLITDRVRNKVYVVFNINSHYTITPLNTETGETGPELVLPRYSAMDKLSIHDNTLYYIYPEKTYPYYQRLFSMVLN